MSVLLPGAAFLAVTLFSLSLVPFGAVVSSIAVFFLLRRNRVTWPPKD